MTDGGCIAGTIIEPEVGLRTEPFAQAAYAFWLGGDFIKNDEPQGKQVFAPTKQVIDRNAAPAAGRPPATRR